YKNRWYIELFFKWIKQHLKVSHLFSHSPAGIW
ncbi:transposase, partial [Sporosarcina psychrophila]